LCEDRAMQNTQCALNNKREITLTSEPAPVTLEPKPPMEPIGSKTGPETTSDGTLASARRVLSTKLSLMRQLYSRTTVCTVVSKLRSL
jgi:hypothetical protein